MYTNLKYLGLGLFIGVVVTALLLIGMFLPSTVAAALPTNTSTPTLTASITTVPETPTLQPPPTLRPATRTYTPTPTYIQPSRTFTTTNTATATNTPTATPTVPTSTPTLTGTMADLIQSGQIKEVGLLNIRQQIQLYQASELFIRHDSAASRLLGEQINGEGYGSPSDICGPLSIAILQLAGVVDLDIVPYDYWLLNPDRWEDRRLLDRAFPPDHYEHIRNRTRLDKMDWSEFPLFPGDFVYLYAGWGGNFEHMLVVNRVDAHGRAYAVTNHNTEDGFIITEVLLYDPNIRNVGMFPFWTERPFRSLGATGFGGFEVWRLRSR